MIFMKKLKFKYDGSSLIRTDTEKLHQHMIEDVLVSFDVRREDKTIMTMFVSGDDKTIVPLKNDRCFVPTSMLNKEFFYMKLILAGVETNYVTVLLSEIVPPSPPEPTPVPPDIFEVIFDKLGTKFDDVQIVDDWLVFYSEESEVARIKLNQGSIDEEVDPIYSASPASDVSYNDIDAWNNKKDSSELDEEYLNLQNYMCS